MKNEMYANLLAEIKRLNAKVDEMMNNDDDDDDDECYDDTSADLESIGDELKEIGNVLNEMYNSDDFGGIPKAIDVNAAEVQNVSEKVERGCYDIAASVDLACGYLEKISDLYEEKCLREKNEFISLNAVHPETKKIVPLKIRISDISLIVDVPDAECVSEILTTGIGAGSAIRVFHSSDEILEIIRKAKRTDYEVYNETLAENGVTEDEIQCYVAHQSSDLAAPYMDMKQIMSYIDEVKKAKAEGFDFSIEHLEERRKAREEKMMKKYKEENDVSDSKTIDDLYKLIPKESVPTMTKEEMDEWARKLKVNEPPVFTPYLIEPPEECSIEPVLDGDKLIGFSLCKPDKDMTLLKKSREYYDKTSNDCGDIE